MEKIVNKSSPTLRNLAKEHLQSLLPHATYRNRYAIAHLSVDGYQDLLFKIRALLNVSIMALEHIDYLNDDTILEPTAHVQSVLELVSRMIPIEEGELLDELAKQAKTP